MSDASLLALALALVPRRGRAGGGVQPAIVIGANTPGIGRNHVLTRAEADTRTGHGEAVANLRPPTQRDRRAAAAEAARSRSKRARGQPGVTSFHVNHSCGLAVHPRRLKTRCVRGRRGAAPVEPSLPMG